MELDTEITSRQAASRLNVVRQTIVRWIKAGKIEARWVEETRGGHYMVSKPDIDRLIKSGTRSLKLEMRRIDKVSLETLPNQLTVWGGNQKTVLTTRGKVGWNDWLYEECARIGPHRVRVVHHGKGTSSKSALVERDN